MVEVTTCGSQELGASGRLLCSSFLDSVVEPNKKTGHYVPQRSYTGVGSLSAIAMEFVYTDCEHPACTSAEARVRFPCVAYHRHQNTPGPRGKYVRASEQLVSLLGTWISALARQDRWSPSMNDPRYLHCPIVG